VRRPAGAGRGPEHAAGESAPARADALTFRAAHRDDIPRLAASVADAFACYRSFAPEGWTPPRAEDEIARMERWIDDPDFWCEAAFAPATLAGHAAMIPASRHSFRAVTDPSLAHLSHLFVAPAFWGSGLATRLIGDAARAGRAKGLTSMRLFVTAGQARARRFYEREGFSAVGEPFDFGLGLPVLEYRR
jgi:GNAT superfamily N-acetyltransferase